MHQLRLFFNFSHSMQTRQIDSRLEFVILFFFLCPFAVQGKHLETLLEDFPPGAVQHTNERYVFVCVRCVFFCRWCARKIDDDEYKYRSSNCAFLVLFATGDHTHTHKNTKPTSADLWHSFEPTTKVFESVTGDSSNITFRLGAIRAFRVIIPSECVIAARKIHKVDEHIHWFIGVAGADARILVGYAFLPKSSIVLCAWRTALVCRCRRSSIVFLPSIFLLLAFRPANGTSWK